MGGNAGEITSDAPDLSRLIDGIQLASPLLVSENMCCIRRRTRIHLELPSEVDASNLSRLMPPR